MPVFGSRHEDLRRSSNFARLRPSATLRRVLKFSDSDRSRLCPCLEQCRPTRFGPGPLMTSSPDRLAGVFKSLRARRGVQNIRKSVLRIPEATWGRGRQSASKEARHQNKLGNFYDFCHSKTNHCFMGSIRRDIPDSVIHTIVNFLAFKYRA